MSKKTEPEAGRIYHISHTYKGEFTCKVVYVAKTVIYATILDKDSMFDEVCIGEDVRLSKRLVTFKEVA